jgi:hypothetical protein
MGSFGIWHWVILLSGFAFIAGSVALVVWLCILVSRRFGGSAATAQVRLQRLEKLKAKGMISEVEYAQQRAVIVGGL